MGAKLTRDNFHIGGSPFLLYFPNKKQMRLILLNAKALTLRVNNKNNRKNEHYRKN